MPATVMILVVCIIVLAVWLVTHVVLVVTCLRTPSIRGRDRWLSPVLAPWLAWREAGHRGTVIAWACLIVLYLVLRVALGAR